MEMQALQHNSIPLFSRTVQRSLISSHGAHADAPDATSFSIACKTPSLSKLFSCTELSFP